MPPCRKRSRRNRDAPILWEANRNNRLVLHYPILPRMRIRHTAELLLLEVDALVIVAGDARADLSGSLALFGQPVGVEAFLGARGALGAMQAFITTAQAGMAERAVTAAVAGKLVEDFSDPGRLLVDVNLPRILEVRAGQL
jgi:hypothetical protein